MKILVLGAGSIGRRRIQIIQLYHELKHETAEIGVYDPYITTLPEGCRVAGQQGDVISSGYDAAFICSPPKEHLSQLHNLMSLDIPCFIEKPFCLPQEVAGAQSYLSIAETRRVPIQVGHNLLWHPYVSWITRLLQNGELGKPLYYFGRFSHYLPYWRNDKDSYSRHVDQGGGVLLDCLQDIDLALEFLGHCSVTQRGASRLSDVTKDSEDAVYIRMQLGENAIGFLHFDYLRHIKERRIEVIGDKATIVWESQKDAMAGTPEHEKLWIARKDQSMQILDSVRDSHLLMGTYEEETAAFLDWVSDNGPAPRIRPDPLRALKVLNDSRV